MASASEGVARAPKPSDDASPSPLVDAAHLFALCGFAIAQPLFDLLGNNPTFLVAHDLDGAGLVLFAVALLAAPPLVLFLAVTVARFFSAATARIVRAGLAGVLVSVTLVPPIHRAIGLSTTAWAVLLVVLAAVAALAYDRVRHLRTFVSYLAPAPVLFLVVFIVLSPASTLVFGTDPASAAVDLEGTRTPVVVVVLDELPLGALLDEEGAIDATRYPGFARLASLSTWYPSATTVSLHTHFAVPAIETGTLPVEEAVPVAASYPRSLFTLFPRTHEVHVSEAVTRLCPRDVCGSQPAASIEASLTSDLQTVYLRSLLPGRTATDWGVPSIGDRWSGFDERTRGRATTTELDTDIEGFFADHPYPQDDEIVRFQTFLSTIEPGASPGMWFHHALLPHTPYDHLPDGRAYNGRGNIAGLGTAFATWSDDPELVQVGAQRLVLQTLATDKLVDALLDRLVDQGMLDDTMLVVVSDHGAVFVPGEHHRGFPVDDRNKHDMLPVPLLVKYPGQDAGRIDRRDARTMDVLPTIVDALGIDLPSDWDFDGRSLLAEDRSVRPLRVVEGAGSVVTVPRPVDPLVMARNLATFLVAGGGADDPFRVGPHGALVGQPVTSSTVGAPEGTVRADDWSAYDSVDLDRTLPALFEATLTGVEPDEWVAVALNGRIAGVGPTFRPQDVTRVVAMLDPAFLRAGANAVDVYRIDGAGTLHRLTPEQ